MRRLLLTVVLLAVFCAGLAISYYNSQPVRFDYLTGARDIPLIALLVAGFVLGMLVAGILNLASHWSLKREARRLQRQLGAAELELRDLRQLPLKSAAGGAGTEGKDA